MALSKTSNVQIRNVTKEELKVLEEFAVKEKWLVSEHIIRACYSYDPDGFFVAVNNDKKPVAFLALCNLNDDVASGSFLIVSDKVRGLKIAKLLMDVAEKHAGGRSIIFNSLPGTKPIFTARGALPTPLCEINCYAGVPDLADINLSMDNVEVIKISEVTFPAIINYDEGIHVIRREQFLSKLLFGQSVSTLIAMKNREVAGYGCVHKRQEKAHIIAPLFADDISIATVLLNNLLVRIDPGSSVSMDVPLTNNGAQQLVESRGFKCTMRTVRMSRGEHPLIPWEKVFFATTVDISVI